MQVVEFRTVAGPRLEIWKACQGDGWVTFFTSTRIQDEFRNSLVTHHPPFSIAQCSPRRRKSRRIPMCEDDLLNDIGDVQADEMMAVTAAVKAKKAAKAVMMTEDGGCDDEGSGGSEGETGESDGLSSSPSCKSEKKVPPLPSSKIDSKKKVPSVPSSPSCKSDSKKEVPVPVPSSSSCKSDSSDSSSNSSSDSSSSRAGDKDAKTCEPVSKADKGDTGGEKACDGDAAASKAAAVDRVVDRTAAVQWGCHRLIPTYDKAGQNKIFNLFSKGM